MLNKLFYSITIKILCIVKRKKENRRKMNEGLEWQISYAS